MSAGSECGHENTKYDERDRRYDETQTGGIYSRFGVFGRLGVIKRITLTIVLYQPFILPPPQNILSVLYFYSFI